MSRLRIALAVLCGGLWPLAAGAHDPVFSPGPHTLFKGGVELHQGFAREESGGRAGRLYESEILYGLSGDWVVGVELPYRSDDRGDGVGATGLRSKWRFWRQDSKGAQETAALLGRVFVDPGKFANGATDALLGLTWGYESLKWYRWASLRYRYNGRDDDGYKRGNRYFADAVIGVRPRKLEYRAPDAVWMLEFNAEYSERSESRGAAVADSGGTELFVSPGLMWTWRNFAVKPGVQIPVYAQLNGQQPATDFRALIEFELHL